MGQGGSGWRRETIKENTMSKLVHIWIDDKVDKVLLDNNYTEMRVYCNGDGSLRKIDCLYQGEDTTVYFYTSEEARDEWIALGMNVQKVIINSPVTEHILLQLCVALRSKLLPKEGIYPTEEKFVMEIGDGWKILDAHKQGNHREFKSFKGITCGREIIRLARCMGCPLDK